MIFDRTIIVSLYTPYSIYLRITASSVPLARFAMHLLAQRCVFLQRLPIAVAVRSHHSPTREIHAELF